MSLTNSQADAAEAIKSIVAASDAAATQSIEKAIEAGHALIAAKDTAPHGTWLPFLARAGVPERKAQRLMKLAASGLKSDTVSDLGGVTGALRFLGKRDIATEMMASLDTIAATPIASPKAAVRLADAAVEASTAIRDMYECFTEESRQQAEAQRVDIQRDVEGWGAKIEASIRSYIAVHDDRLNAARDAILNHVRSPSPGSAMVATIALGVLDEEIPTASIERLSDIANTRFANQSA